MRKRRQEGLALVLVMTVVLALAIVATPFVLSMLLQERSGTVSRYVSQAEFGLDGVRNFAMWRLMQSLDPVERRSGQIRTYHFDDRQEFDVRLDEMYLDNNRRNTQGQAVSLDIANPKGSIWGLVLQDEQGKLNVKTAPDGAINRIKQLVNGVAGNHKDYLTLYSGRDASWVVPQRIRSMGTRQQGQNVGSGVWCDSLHVLAPGSRVRITKSGVQQPVYAIVSGNPILGTGATGLTTNPMIPQAMMEGVIEVEARHPVNLNTARREVLIAVFEGLNIFNQPTSMIDAPTAIQLANLFYGQRVTRLEDFLLRLAGAGLNPQQYQAVALNAVCPSWAGLNGSGTVPFCFRSYDVYTVETYASQNNPAGVQVAGRGAREVVSVSPPNQLTLTCESQWDFDRMLLGVAAAVQRRDLLGYPYGNLVTTFPNMLPSPYPTAPPSKQPAPSDLSLKPQAAGNESYVTQLPARDPRGEGDQQTERDLKNWQRGYVREHFDNDQEGRVLNGAAFTYPWDQVFAQMPAASTNPPPVQTFPDVAAGGVEFWVKFDSVSDPQTILDIKEDDKSNRLTLRVERGELIFTACDSTIGIANELLDDGLAEVRQPFTPAARTWYHVAAYWKGTRYAQLAMLVDGFAHPQQKFGHVTPELTPVMTELGADLAQGATSISLRDTNFLPTYTTPLLIGNEVVLYDKNTNILIRGARGTQDVFHPAKAVVTLFGYSSKLRNGNVTADFGNGFQVNMPYRRLPVGGGNLTYNFGLNPQAQVAGDKPNPTNAALPPIIDAMQADIGVTTANIMDYPDQGYLTIDGEVIFYTGRTTGGVGGAGNAKFTGCVRGQQGTVGAQHDTGRQVRMWSVAVTNTANYDSPTVIQVGDEWFGPVQRDTARAGFWISFVNAGAPVNLRRGNGVFGSIQGAHAAADPVMPTFLVRETHPQVGTENLGRGDRVTLVDAQNYKEMARVRNASPAPPPQGQPATWPNTNFNLPGNHQLAAMEQNVTREFVADDLYVRVLKFPSGELLGRQWLTTASPQFTIGPLSGIVDEIKVYATAKQDLQLAGTATDSDNMLSLSRGGGLGNWPRGGLVKVGDEYIGYGQFTGGQPAQLSQLKRGWLLSQAQVHDAGDRVFSLYWVPVSTLATDLTATDRDITLNQRLPGRPQDSRLGPGYKKGYLLIDQELVLFEWNGQNPFTELGMPPKWDGNEGLYRGMFGTQAASHPAATTLVYGIPWRYWDTYKPQEFDNTMSYYQWSVRLDQAKWGRLRWTQEIPENDPLLQVHCLVRLDGKAEFWDPPDKNFLFEFLTPTGATLNRVGHQGEAGQLDVRFYWEYKPGSYNPLQPWNAHSWKRAPKIKEVQVDYDRPSQVLYHEDR